MIRFLKRYYISLFFSINSRFIRYVIWVNLDYLETYNQTEDRNQTKMFLGDPEGQGDVQGKCTG